MWHRLILFSFVLFIFCSSITSQSYSFINYSIQDGLAQSQATDILQDDKGYLWISSLGGLSRFDGQYFTNYSKEDGLVDNHVHTIFHDHGNIYAGATGGLSLLKDNTITNYKLPIEHRNSKVISITKDGAKKIWLGTDRSGLWCLQNDSLSHMNELPFENIWSLLMDDKTLWLGTETGLFKYRALEDKWSMPFPELNEAAIHDLIKGSDGSIWVATYQGIFHFKNEELKNYSSENGLISDRIKDIHEDQNGNIWLSSKQGITKISDNGIINFSHRNGLENHDIKAISSDSENNIWLASNSNGIYRFASENIQTLRIDDGVCSEKALSIISGTNGDIWISSFENGVCRISENEVVHFNENIGLSNNTVWASLMDHEKNLWFGTSSGLNRLNDSEIVQYREPGQLGNNRITSLFQDSKQRIWIGHKYGVRVFENEEFKSYSSKNGMYGTRVRNITQDKNGVLWFGADNGLFKFFEGSYSKVTSKGVLEDNSVLNISIGEQDELWLGTKNGLYVYNGVVAKRVNFDKIFSSQYINFTRVYNTSLLIGTNNGLYILDLSKYHAGNSNYIKHFGSDDGLLSLECNLNSSCIDENGILWFGTGKGTVKADVESLISNKNIKVPKVLINNVRVFMNDSIERGGSKMSAFGIRQFQPSENHITFDLTGIALSSPKSVKYEYRLKGLQEELLPLSNVSFVSFPYLPHGEFEFEIFAISKAGERSTVPATYSFEITAPFYKTTWFYAAMVLLGMLIGSATLFWR